MLLEVPKRPLLIVVPYNTYVLGVLEHFIRGTCERVMTQSALYTFRYLYASAEFGGAIQ